MSIDYDAVFGVGYEVDYDCGHKDADEIEEDGLGEWLEDKLPVNYEWGQSGNFLSGCGLCTYIFRKDPCLEGVSMTLVKAELDKICDDLGLTRESKFGVVGGCCIS